MMELMENLEKLALSRRLPVESVESMEAYYEPFSPFEGIAIVRTHKQLYCMPRQTPYPLCYLLRILEPKTLPGILENLKNMVPLKIQICGEDPPVEYLFCPFHFALFDESYFPCTFDQEAYKGFLEDQDD